MKRIFGVLMVVGLLASVVGCGDDDNPMNSDADRLVGTWVDIYGDSVTFRSDRTFVDSDGDEGTQSLVGNQLTTAYYDEDYGGATTTLNSVTDNELTLTGVDGDRVTFTRRT